LVPVIVPIRPSGRQILPGSLRFTKIVSLGLGTIYGGGFPAMELTTILNRCHRFRGFVYEHIPQFLLILVQIADRARRKAALQTGVSTSLGKATVS
jgi:hypothetical protein